MAILERIIDQALSTNNDSMLVIAARASSGLTSAEVERLTSNAHKLHACWYVVQPVIAADSYIGSLERLQQLRQLLGVEQARDHELELISRLTDQLEKPKLLRLLAHTRSSIETEREYTSLDVDQLSVGFQSDSAAWRGLNIDPQSIDPQSIDPQNIDPHNMEALDEELMERFRCGYEQGRNLGKAVFKGKLTSWASEWPETVSMGVHLLALANTPEDRESGAQQWYLGRLLENIQNSRACHLLMQRWKERGEKVPRGLKRALKAQNERLYKRQMKLYGYVFGQTIEELNVSFNEG